MADQAEVTKLVMHPIVGGYDDEAKVSKLVMYVVLIPGSDDSEAPQGRGYVHTQIIRRS